MARISVMIVDDQDLFAISLKTYIHNYTDDIHVVGMASNGEQALTLVEECHPHLILMDVHMPQMNGVECTKILMEKNAQQKILMLSTYDKDEYVQEALSYGAVGYLLKDLSPTELIASIRAVSSGVTQISPTLVQCLIRKMDAGHSSSLQSVQEELEVMETLTNREREIFTRMATGFDNEQIAEELCISERTVRNHVSSVYAKLGVHNRFEIIQLANKIPFHA